ncbi:FAD-dependent oxidoreductase [Chroococcidiopsis thermalis]|jgi:malate dehydrogenase (quinone)|uniref:malate dehydrogenase (quinone) n=1 Tax=Chroococcidiopsis thermalis (strain PCC 7203) TaxID=251229 RepID=K9TUJ6_CHRTP|nr:FAD-dependent oxidoreductase [Chroococcidiopsis thermalis]AFY85674.1 Malate dehydrogenase (acceptor) [Chroococcidiopsis thermalis PCC 7203]
MLLDRDKQTVQSGNIPYEVAIIGAGISGTALLYSLSKYTNVERILLVEKEAEVGLCNSHKTMNSQTLHFGDIETNYTLEKAQKVNRAATLVKNYLLRNDTSQKSYSKYHKLVLGIGAEQVQELRDRYREFQSLFPQLKLIQKPEIEAIEPNLIKDRKPDEEIIALYSEAGYTIDFQALSRSFLQNSIETKKTIDIMMSTKVKSLKREKNLYHIQTDRGTFSAKSVAFATGAYSLLFAKTLGYGKDYALLNVAGNFYFSPGVLNGKVYTVQMKKIPFAAIHGDPEVHDQSLTRFGPTAKVTLLLENRKYATVLDYLKTAGFSINAIISFLNILSDKTIFNYILRNLIYDLPLVGKRLFLKEARKIVPSLQLNELQFAEGYGGIRPQIVNTKTKHLEMGEAKIVGENIIFNITPSPGASTCLQNAEYDTEKIVAFLGAQYTFNKQQFWKDLGDE